MAISNDDIYIIANETAQAHVKGRKPDDVVEGLAATIREQSVDANDVKSLVNLEPERMLRIANHMHWLNRETLNLVAQVKAGAIKQF